ncbi:MAG: glycosyltransferase [Thaumarchaeota archaeon]|nr:glycosyltransferase [Nitrososphaerota archaeon]
MTHYNSGATVEKSINSILSQIDDQFEIVVVDNLSKDGSRSILQELARRGLIKLIEKKCSRGKGREIAFEEARGQYVISGLDMDEAFKPRLLSLLDFYHKKCEGKLLRGKWQGTIVAPRRLVAELGGWRDLQYSENWDLQKRAAQVGLYRWTIFLLTEGAENRHPERWSFRGATRYRYIMYRENLRVGHRLFQPNESIGLQKRLIELAALVSLPFYGSYRGGVAGFTSNELEYFVDSRDWWYDGTDAERERERYGTLLGKEFP